jgi:hypothetical protein
MGAGIAVCRSPQGASDAAEDFYEGSRRGQCVFRPVCEMLWAGARNRSGGAAVDIDDAPPRRPRVGSEKQRQEAAQR